MFSGLLYSCVYATQRLTKRVSRRFWQWYQIQTLRHTAGVLIKNTKTLFFKGKCVLLIENGAHVNLGEYIYINSGEFTSFPVSSKIIVSTGASLSIGNNTGLSAISIICKCSVVIGNNVNIGAGSFILDSNMHSLDWQVRKNREFDRSIDSKKAPIVIEDNVFIGARCIITKGVTIGQNAIIAAGSVVVKSIPANCIAGGNPCRMIKLLD